MNTFVTALATRVESYIALQHALGYQFHKQAASLRAFLRYVHASDTSGPLSQPLWTGSTARLSCAARANGWNVCRCPRTLAQHWRAICVRSVRRARRVAYSSK